MTKSFEIAIIGILSNAIDAYCIKNNIFPEIMGPLLKNEVLNYIENIKKETDCTFSSNDLNTDDPKALSIQENMLRANERKP